MNEPGPAFPLKSSAGDVVKRLAFLELNEADGQRLRELSPRFRSWSNEFVEHFYRHLFKFEETARFLQNPVRVERLKHLQREHLESMLEARWDEAYIHRRHVVGQTHAEAGIEPQFFLGAYNQYVKFLFERLVQDDSNDISQYKDRVLSVLKAIFFDVGLTLDAYFAELTQDLRHALDMFWRANAELRNFAQLTSHDLKTPLATVANLCDEALDEFGNAMPDAARQLVEAARTRAFRMSRMIDELLASAITPDTMEANQEIASEEAIHEAIELVRPLLDKSGIELTVPVHLPKVWGNKIRLRETFVNLLSNAAKYIDKPTGKVEIMAQTEGDDCVFIVADNGPGIPAEELERVFVPFRRLPAHRDRPGSGLGLYFSRNLMAQQGGRIWVESKLGEGSRFFVQLRQAEPAEG